MHDKLLSSLTSDENVKNLYKKKDSINRTHFPFQEILCPKTGKELKSQDCVKCSYKETLSRTHPLGLYLSATICSWNVENE